jgi:vibriolysin
VALSYAFDFAGLKFEIHEQLSGPGAAPHLAMNTSLATRILGGGAEVILEDPAGAGSLLTASWPVSGAEWDARAKDHDIPSPARVRLVCICAAIPQDQYTIASTTTPARTNHPEATAQLPAEYILVGGGARADWPFGDPGSLLYASRPGVGESWYAASKDHVQASPATVTAFAIGVRRRFLDQLGLTVVRIEGDCVEAAPHPVVGCAMDDGRALLVAGGAHANWTGPGSLLTWVARAKDHEVPDPATLTAWGLALLRR